MSKLTKKDYKKFLAEFQQNNPQLEMRRFGFETPNPHQSLDEDDKNILEEAKKEENWEEREDYWDYARPWQEEKKLYAYESGNLKGYSYEYEPNILIPKEQIKDVKAFEMITSDGQISYLLLELVDGTLRLGSYIGD